jgi:hypothetical protein
MRARETQRGSVLATAVVVLAGLLGVAGLSVISVQRSLGVSGQQRGHAQALHASEAGVIAAAVFLRKHMVEGSSWGPYVVANCTIGINGCPSGDPVAPLEIVGNFAAPGTQDNQFLPAAQAMYEVTLYNNPTDPQLAQGVDSDNVIVIRSVGRGPDGSRVVIEVEVEGTPGGSADSVCVGYAQQGLSELNSGRNDCFQGLALQGDVDSSKVQRYTPSQN